MVNPRVTTSVGMKDPWESKEVFDRRTGKVERFYTYKRKPCKRVELTSPLARQLAGYVLIEKDLRSVAAWLSEIASRHTEGPQKEGEEFGHSNDRVAYTLIKGLFVAALTFYGKCFAQCEGRRIKLERSQLEARYHATHDQAITFRNNFAAHSGAAKLESVDVALVLPHKPGVLPRIYNELQQPDLLWSPTNEGSFLELVEYVRAMVVSKIQDLSEKILSEEVVPKGPEYWKRK
jgi:hypothetical protein